jgi:hypothetical protein
MSQFANALGKRFVENQELVRTRSFEMNGHTFQIKVPTTLEFEAITERIKQVDEDKVNKYYLELSKPFIENKTDFEKEGVDFQENDVFVKGRSLKETAKNKVITENRITEMFKLIVPEDKSFDMNTITYDMVEELFPFSIQLEVVDNITRTISPSYESSKGK